MREVNRFHFVGRLLIVGVQAEARDRLRDHTAARKLNVVRTREEILFRVRIGENLRASLRERGAKIAAFVTRQPERVCWQSLVRAADHLEFEIRDDRVERNGGCIDEMSRPSLGL